MKRAARFKTGTVVFDKRRKTWNFLWWEEGKRRSKLIGTLQEYPTKGAAKRASQFFRSLQEKLANGTNLTTMRTLVSNYRTEKMPQRHSTRLAYECWLNNHILPKWGDQLLADVQARPVELWLKTLQLAPKSQSHIRGLLHVLWDFAMWRGDVPIQRNPIELVTVRGATKRTRKPRSLNVEEFQKFIQHLEEPFRTVALLSVCFGLRISECLALKWADVDWLKGRLRVERGIVRRVVDDVKTAQLRTAHEHGCRAACSVEGLARNHSVFRSARLGLCQPDKTGPATGSHTPAFCTLFRKRLRTLALAPWERTQCATATALGLTLWVPRLRFSRN
jgi:integrase